MNYYPFANGRYEVKPGLKKLGTDFGNGSADQALFQIGEDYQAYWQNKIDCRKENMHKYYQCIREQPDTLQTVSQFILQQIIRDYPQHFHLEEKNGGFYFINHLTGKSFYLDENRQLSENSGYISLTDALASQVSEDMAIWQSGGEQDYLSTIHLCAPNHWAPAEKIGKPFSAVHIPVAGMETLRARYRPMLRTLVKGGSFVRFAWGLGTDNRLNHHPEPPPGADPGQWQGRHFNPDQPALYVRVERQTLTGFPKVQAMLFTIRTYFEEVVNLDREKLEALRHALAMMSEESLRYKGLYGSKTAILHWMERL